MFKKKTREPLASDATDNIHPWEMLGDAETAAHTARLRERWPNRPLVAFARRIDRDVLACFDKGLDGAGKGVLVVEGLDGKGEPAETPFPGFGAWFDMALADAGEPSRLA